MPDETRDEPQAELSVVIASYLEAVDEGRAPDPDELLARHPHLAAELRSFLAIDARMAGTAAPRGAPGTAETLPLGAGRTLGRDDLPAAGAEFGAYDLLELVGEGGMGVVFKARHRELGRVVALKLILAGRLARPSDLERFWIEARAAARLSDEGIVRLYEVGNHNGLPFIVSEFCPGGSLDKKLGGKPVSPGEAARTVRGLAEAVQKAHDASIVHRDLKPGNVLITADGRYKVGDFGLAKLLDEAGTLSVTNAIVGSPPYMSPEQAEGRGRLVGRQSDVYSLGAILYEMLTGRPPFRGSTPTETLLRVVGDTPVPPHRLNRGIPADLETICLRCLEKNPALRFATARDLADDLGRFLRGEPIASRPVGPLGRARRWCRRNKAVAVLLAAVCAVLVAGTSVSVYYAVEADSRATAEGTARAAADRATGEAHRATGEAKAAGERAVRERDSAIHQRYAADCARFQIAWEQGEYGRLHELLNRWLPEPGLPDPRGWEWHYLRGQCDRQMILLEGHRGKVAAVGWHPNGGLVMSACYDGLLKIWDAESGRLVRDCVGHTSNVYSASWSPDGSRIASCGLDGAVIVWDAERGKILRKIERAHGGQPVYAVAWKSDGRAVASVGQDSAVRVWEPSTGEPLAVIETGARHLAWSRDGRSLAVSRANEIVVYDATTWARTGGWPTVGAGVLAWSPDGSRLAFGSRPVTVWNVATGKQTRTLPGAEGDIHALSWDSRERLAAASRDQTVRVWDAGTGKLTATHRVHWGIVETVAWSPDGRRLVSSDLSGSVRIYAAAAAAARSYVVQETGQPCSHLSWSAGGRLTVGEPRLLTGWHPERGFQYRTALDAPGAAFAASSDGSRVAVVVTGGDCLLFDTERGEIVTRYATPMSETKEPVYRLAFSGDGKLLATAGRWPRVYVWAADTGQAVAKLAGAGAATESVFGVAWHPHRDRLALAGQPHVVQVVNRDGGTPRVFAEHAAEVYRVQYSPDGRLLASGSGDGDIIIRDSETGAVRHALRGHVHAVFALAWTGDGRRLASGSSDRTVRIWDAETGEQLLVLRDHAAGVQALAWDRESGRLASGDARGTVLLWGAAGADEPRRSVVAPEPREAAAARWVGHSGTVRDIAVSADGKLAVSCSGWPNGDGTIRVWDVATGEELRQLRGSKGHVSAVRFVGDTHKVMAGGFDRVPRMWDADTGLLLREFSPHPTGIQCIDLTPDGRTLVVVGNGRTLWSWDVENPARATKTWSVPPKTTGMYRVLAGAVSADGKWVLAGGDPGELLHIELATGRVPKRLQHGSGIEACALSPDGKFGVSGGFDARVVQWDLATGKMVREFKGHTQGVQDISFSPDGKLMVTAGFDATVRLWEFATGKELRVYRSHSEPVWTARFTPDGRHILAGGGSAGDYVIRVLDVPKQLVKVDTK